MSDNLHLKQHVLELLAETKHMTLATVEDAEPWAVTVMFAFDDELHLYFYSDPNTKHCRDIAKNPHVAIAIRPNVLNPGQVQGIQLTGIASGGNEKDHAVFKTRHPWADRYSDHKVYKVTPSKWYYLDSALFGHMQKVEIDL